MWRIVLTIAGIAFMVLALVMIWITSPVARIVLARAGIGINALDPKDVSVLFVLVFGLGFILFMGSLLEAIANSISHGLTGGHTMSREQAMSAREEGLDLLRRFSWGFPPYLVLALGLGLYVHLGVQREQFSLAWLVDPRFLGFSLTWPYQLTAAIAPWGLTADRFF